MPEPLPGLPGGAALRAEIADLLKPLAAAAAEPRPRGLLNTPGLGQANAEPLTAETLAAAIEAIRKQPLTAYIAPDEALRRQITAAELGLEIITSPLVEPGQIIVADLGKLKAELTIDRPPLGESPLTPPTAAQDTAYRYEMRVAMMGPRLVTRRRADLEHSTAERYVCRAHTARRPWHSIRRAMAAAFRAAWHDALGTTYQAPAPGSNHHAIISGIA